MTDSTEISFAELRMAAIRLIDAAERRFGPQLQLDAGRYWSIFPSDRFNLDSQPPIGAGETGDDVATIRELLQRTDPDEDDLLLWHDLDHFAGILARISNLAGA